MCDLDAGDRPGGRQQQVPQQCRGGPAEELGGPGDTGAGEPEDRPVLRRLQEEPSEGERDDEEDRPAASGPDGSERRGDTPTIEADRDDGDEGAEAECGSTPRAARIRSDSADLGAARVDRSSASEDAACATTSSASREMAGWTAGRPSTPPIFARWRAPFRS